MSLEKTAKKRLLAMLLCVAMVFTVLPISVFATQTSSSEQPGVAASNPEEGSVPAAVCICESKCEEETVNRACEICKADAAGCTAQKSASETTVEQESDAVPRPTESATCTCKIKCNENSATVCTACKVNGTACLGALTALVPEPAAMQANATETAEKSIEMITFDVRNGASLSDVEIDADLAFLPMPAAWGDNEAQNNYTFAGWYTGIDGADKQIADAAGNLIVENKPLVSTTVYAKWTKSGKVVRTEQLTFRDVTENMSNEEQGWNWDNATKTLTLNGLTLNTQDESGILLSNDSAETIIINGMSTVICGGERGSYAIKADALTVKGAGTLYVTSGALSGGDVSAGILALEEFTLESGELHLFGGSVEGVFGISTGLISPKIMLKDGRLYTKAGAASPDSISVGIGGSTIAIDGGTLWASGTNLAIFDVFPGRAVRKDPPIVIAEGGYLAGNAEYNKNEFAPAHMDEGVLLDSLPIWSAYMGESGAATIAKTIKVSFEPTLIINTQPVNLTVTEGAITENLSLKASTINAGDAAISYQWYRNTVNSATSGTPISGAIRDTYALPDNLAKGEYYYYCVLKAAGCEEVTSAIATVTVKKMVGSISGVIKKGGILVQGATVELYHLDGTKIEGKQVITDAEGTYRFEDIEQGLYNIKITNGNKTNIIPVIVDRNTIVKNIGLPNIAGTGNANTTVETKPSTPKMTADLNELFNAPVADVANKGITQADKEVIAKGGTVGLHLTAEQKKETEIKEDNALIKAFAKDDSAHYLYVDLSITKMVKTSGGSVGVTKLKEVNDLVEISIEIPAECQPDNLRIFRVHEGVAEELTSVANSFGEKLTINRAFNIVTLTVKRFSTFAFSNAALLKTITFDANGGSVSPASAKTNAAGQLAALPTPTRNDSYRFDGWYTSATGGTQVTLATVFTNNSTIYAHWAANEETGNTGNGGATGTAYTITATAGAGGNISTGQYVSVPAGGSAGFTMMPDKGYVVADVKVDGKSVGAVSNYVFTNVRANHTIAVSFKASSGHANPQTGVTGRKMF